MGQRWIWGSAVLVFFLVPIPSAGQQQARKATVHVVFVDGFGRDISEATVVSFKNTDNDHAVLSQHAFREEIINAPVQQEQDNE